LTETFSTTLFSKISFLAGNSIAPKDILFGSVSEFEDFVGGGGGGVFWLTPPPCVV
jgi:hypothetical protein